MTLSTDRHQKENKMPHESEEVKKRISKFSGTLEEPKEYSFDRQRKIIENLDETADGYVVFEKARNHSATHVIEAAHVIEEECKKKNKESRNKAIDMMNLIVEEDLHRTLSNTFYVETVMKEFDSKMKQADGSRCLNCGKRKHPNKAFCSALCSKEWYANNPNKGRKL